MNVISYAYDDEGFHEISVCLSLYDNTIKLEIVDDGKEFEPDYSSPPLEGLDIFDAPIGGLGIHLMHCLMDECVYHRKQGKNNLTLTLNL
jgi:anti-sigma regulatory factor (Ser/Thr protein kinase)